MEELGQRVSEVCVYLLTVDVNGLDQPVCFTLFQIKLFPRIVVQDDLKE